MAINTITLAEKMTDELDRAVVQKSVTGFFCDNAVRAKFVGANTVLIPNVELSGLGNYDRDDGFAQGSINVSNTAYDLTMDRGRSHAGRPGLRRERNTRTCRTGNGRVCPHKVIPELDAYVLSELGYYAEQNSQTVNTSQQLSALKTFTEACNKVYNETGYDEELVAFVNGSTWADLQESPEILHFITVNDFKQGGIDLKVKTVNGVPILPVPDGRMKTIFEFYDGRTTGSPDQTVGGFYAPLVSKNIGMLVLPRRAAALVKKTEKIRIFDPDKNQQADAWKFDYRIYYGLIIKESLKRAIYAYVY